jgi:hypothetical protein
MCLFLFANILLVLAKTSHSAFPFKSVAFILDIQGCNTNIGAFVPSQAALEQFKTYYWTQVKYGMPWFFSSCSYSNTNWQWVREDHHIFEDNIIVPCKGKTPNSKLKYNMDEMLGAIAPIAYEEYAQQAYITKYGSAAYAANAQRTIILNIPDHFSSYGFAHMNCFTSGCSICVTASRSFPHTGIPRVNTIVHEMGHTLSLLHAQGKNWEYGDCSCIMGCADSVGTCFGATNARQLGWATSIADLDDVSMPSNLWIPYVIPIFTTSSVNHLTIRSFSGGNDGSTKLILAARSKTAGINGADSQINNDMDKKLIVQATKKESDYDNWQSILLGVLGINDVLDMAREPSGHHKMNVVIKVSLISDISGAVFSVCRYTTTMSSCTYENPRMNTSMQHVTTSSFSTLPFGLHISLS